MNRHTFDSSEDHTEESYLASLSDLMVGMLFFFIILLMAFALNYHAAEKESADAKNESAEQAIAFHLKSQETEAERRALIAEKERLTLDLTTRTLELNDQRKLFAQVTK